VNSLGIPELIIVMVVIVSVVVVPWWSILKKSGNAPVLSLLMFIPLLNLGLLFWFAFAEWPIERDLKALRQQGRT
jgi:hypothetical protein